LALLPGPPPLAIAFALALLTAEPPPAPAPPNPQPAPAPSETEAPPSKTGLRPLLGVTPRPGPSADLPKPPKDPAQRREWLKAQLDEVFNGKEFTKSKVSAIVVDADTGKTLYARAEKTPLNAASNVKIVTSASGLSLLGPEYRWRTTLSIVGPPSGPPLPASGEAAGDLYVRGSGDPTLATEDLAAMVGDLAALGLHKVRGSLVVDDSLFEGGYIPPAYDQKNDSTASRAPASAASLNGNVVAVTVVPGAAAGAAAHVVVDPPSPYFTIAGRVVTATSGPHAPAVDTKEEPAHTRVNVAGRIRLGSDPRTFYRRVAQPSLFLGYTLKQLMERRGITIGAVKVGRAPAQGLRVLAAHDSAPLAVAVHDLNKRSNNFAAEQLLRTMGAEIGGRPGTWDKGLKAVDRYLTGIGIKTGSYQMQNGSGLYDSNRFSAEQIVTILRAASRDFRISAEFLASLAVAGTDGTIAHRMGGTLAERYVRAKTGTLATVSCLSGFAGSPGHTPLVFSILVNDTPSAIEARRAQDRAAEILVAYLEADTPATK
jgi:D-alanyl-D-alanine carboxypeptidase/D-alanyl-D-alanine-endopeptidase (penicillin-binding protein 4)